MTKAILEHETSNYWNLIKDASNEVKLALIVRLSSSLVNDDEETTSHRRPLKARRLNAMTTEELEQEMQDEPMPLTGHDDYQLSDLVAANSGKITKGLERWL